MDKWAFEEKVAAEDEEKCKVGMGQFRRDFWCSLHMLSRKALGNEACRVALTYFQVPTKLLRGVWSTHTHPPCLNLGPLHMHPKSQGTPSQSVQSQPLRARKLGLTTTHEVPSLKSPTWHGCLDGNTFWGVRFGACVHNRVKQKTTLNSQHESHAYCS